MAKPEARYKIVLIPEYQILDLIVAGVRRKGNWVVLPVLANLPDGYQVCAVHYFVDRRAFGFRVWHESFPVVPDGELTPFLYENGVDPVMYLRFVSEKDRANERVFHVISDDPVVVESPFVVEQSSP